MQQRLTTFVACGIFAAASAKISFAQDAPAAAEEEADNLVPIKIAELDRTEPVDFAKEILPLLKKNCIACHSASKAKSKLNLETPQTILKGGTEGPAIVPGKADESLLLLAAAHMEEPAMPPADNKANAVDFSPEELALLKLWINQGAKGEASVVLAAPAKWNPVTNTPIFSLDVSRFGRFTATGRGNRVDVHETSSGRLTGQLIDPELAKQNRPVAHLDVVQSLAFGSQGTIATGGFRTLKLWKRARQVVEKSFPGMPENVTSLAVSSDGKLAAAGDATGNVRLWNLEGEAKPKDAKIHNGAVKQLAFANKGDRLFSASADKTLQILQVADLKSVAKLEFGQAFHDIALVKDDTVVASCGEDAIVRLWQVPAELPGEWKPLKELPGHGKNVTGVSAVPSNSGELISFSAEDGQIKVWTIDDGKNTRTVTHGAALKSISVSPDGQRLVSTGTNMEIKTWNFADGKAIATTPKGSVVAAHHMTALEQRKSAADKLAAARKKKLEAATKRRDDTAKDVDAKAAALASAEANTARKQRAERDTARALEDQTQAKVGKDELKKATDAANKAKGEFNAARDAVKKARINRDLAVKISGDAAKAYYDAQANNKNAEALVAELVKDIEASKKDLPKHEKALERIAVSADGALTVAVNADGSFHLADAKTGTALDVVNVPAAKENVIATAGGSRFLTGSQKSAIVLRDFSPGWKLAKSLGAANDPKTLVDRVTSIAFSPDARLVATGSGVPSRTGELKIWNVADGKQVAANLEAHTDTIVGIAFSPDGRFIATASTDRMMKVFNVADGSFVRKFEGHTGHVLDVAWQSDGLVLATAGADKVAKLWDFETGRQTKTEKGFGKEVTSVGFSSTSDSLLTGSGDKNVKFGGQALAGNTDFVHIAVISHDGSIVAAGGQDGTLRIWQVKDKKLIHSLPAAAAN